MFTFRKEEKKHLLKRIKKNKLKIKFSKATNSLKIKEFFPI
jgi:hypothetical protein